MQMLYTSTRAKQGVSPSRAVIDGISPEGGLYVPVEIPMVSPEWISEMRGLSYQQRAARVLSLFFTEFSHEEMEDMCQKAYGDDRFDDSRVAPLHRPENSKAHYLELFHGPTQAFKDMALQMLPHLMSASMKLLGAENETVILVATSGDTGKAALEGFRDVPGTRVIVFYPDGGVSAMQRLQMATQRGENVHVWAVEGNFDDAQTGVKKIFADKALEAELSAIGKSLSSANSINFGRLAPQIAYYFSAYADLLSSGEIKLGDKVNFCVPTGNFGNILACEYARRMGLPVGKMVCASNSNNVLTDFIQTGDYDARREFIRTISPSMDILISSNVERLLFELCERDEKAVAEMMAQLSSKGAYSLPVGAAGGLKELFYGIWVDEGQTRAEIKRVFDEYGYMIDPHTAVASAAYERYLNETGDKTETVIVSTASPYKFAGDVSTAICGENPAITGEMIAADFLESFTGRKMPPALKELRHLPSLHGGVCEKERMKDTVKSILEGTI
jgi:threonine synthase